MAGKNKNKPQALRTLDAQDVDADMELGDALPPEAFENLELGVAQDTQDEVMANELYMHRLNFLTTETARKAARDSGDHAQAETLARRAAYHRMMAARILYYWPQTRQIADDIAQVNTLRVRAERRSVLQTAQRDQEAHKGR